MSAGTNGDDEQDREEYEADQASLDEGQAQELLNSYAEALTKANTTIVNLLRKEPLLYLEVAESAIVQSITRERETWENENRRMKDKLKAVRYIAGRAQQGEYRDVDHLLSVLMPIVRRGL